MQKKKQSKDKKKNNKEVEAEKLEQERLEREKQEKETLEKFGINSFTKTSRIPMLLTEWFTTTCWNHDSPRKFAKEHFLKMVENLNIDKLILDEEIEMFSNATIYNLIHAKDKLKFNDKKSCYFINLMLYLLINKDKRFSSAEYEFIGDKKEEEDEEAVEDKKGKRDKKGKKKETAEIEDDEEALVDEEEEFDREEIQINTSNFEEKSYESDLRDFRALVGQVFKENLGLFDKEEVARIVTYAVDWYFANWRLYRYCQTNVQTEENIYLQVSIDEPSIPEPLSTANYIGKIMTPEDIEAERLKKIEEEEERKKTVDNEKKKREEEARKEYEQWMGLDDQTVQMIKNKLEETKNYMMKRVEEKKAEYEEKAANSKNFKKKKR